MLPLSSTSTILKTLFISSLEMDTCKLQLMISSSHSSDASIVGLNLHLLGEFLPPARLLHLVDEDRELGEGEAVPRLLAHPAHGPITEQYCPAPSSPPITAHLATAACTLRLRSMSGLSSCSAATASFISTSPRPAATSCPNKSWHRVELQTKVREDFTITKKTPTSAFS